MVVTSIIFYSLYSHHTSIFLYSLYDDYMYESRYIHIYIYIIIYILLYYIYITYYILIMLQPPKPNHRAFQLGRPKPLRKMEPSRLGRSQLGSTTIHRVIGILVF